MSRSRGTAVAIALLSAALAAAGCGFGAGDGVGEVSLTVTRDYGAEPLLPAATEEVSEADTVMRVLDRSAAISTRYGGGFVQAIWWDFRNWSAAARVPAVVGSWPRPLAGGYEGKRRPVALECRRGGSACAVARRRLAAAGVVVAGARADGAIRVLVGPWARLREDPAAAQLEDGPQTSGVFAEFVRDAAGYRLRGLDEGGEPARGFGPDAGLVAATRRYGAPPVWIVSGATGRGTLAAVKLLAATHLRDRYAVATEAGRETPLPIR